MTESQRAFAELAAQYNSMSERDQAEYSATVKAILTPEMMTFTDQQQATTDLITANLEMEQLMARLGSK